MSGFLSVSLAASLWVRGVARQPPTAPYAATCTVEPPTVAPSLPQSARPATSPPKCPRLASGSTGRTG